MPLLNKKKMTATQKRISLRTEADALAYLDSKNIMRNWIDAYGDAEHGYYINNLDGMPCLPETKVEAGLYTITSCGSCGGTGEYKGHSGYHRRGFKYCFSCDGTGDHKFVALKDFAKKIRNQELRQARNVKKATKKQEKMLEGQRNWCEDNTEFGRVTFAEREALVAAEKEAALEKQRAENAHLQHVGALKQRQWFEDMVFCKKSEKTYGEYNETRLFTFATEEGHLVYFYGKTNFIESFDLTKRFSFKATPVDHTEWHGICQTRINRLANFKNS